MNFEISLFEAAFAIAICLGSIAATIRFHANRRRRQLNKLGFFLVEILNKVERIDARETQRDAFFMTWEDE
jgi:hypothetical protein